MRLTLEEVLKATGGQLAGSPSSSVIISGVSTDTRTLQPGDLFVPLRGPRAEGHSFIPEAFRKGAAASLVTRQEDGAAGPVIVVADGLHALADLARYYRTTLDVRVVGITGSVGKTTTTGMCASVLGSRFNVARTLDEWNAEIGVPLMILGLTPEHQVAVIEMAMRGLGQIAELVTIAQPDVGVVTNIGESHVELLGSIDNVANAKGELIEGLPASGTAILNADDPRVRALAARSKGRVVTYGTRAKADIRGVSVKFTDSGMRFAVQTRARRAEAALAVFGMHNVSNALASVAVGTVMGIDLQAICDALSRYTPPKMRLQPVQAHDVLIINDAYNASPASMSAAFEVLKAVARGRRRVVVLGEMKELGPGSPLHHHHVGLEAGDVAEILIAVGGEDAAEILRGSRMAPDRIYHVPSPMRANELLRTLLRSGDIVLVKGSRAMEMERVVDGILRARTPGPEAPQA